MNSVLELSQSCAVNHCEEWEIVEPAEDEYRNEEDTVDGLYFLNSNRILG